MFGSNYAQYPKLLMLSLREMNDWYKGTEKPSWVLEKLQIIYVKLFGVPEIGFQLRYHYFRKALQQIKTAKITKILDMGSGIGTYVFYLASVYPNAVVDGWDTDTQKIKLSKELQKKFGFDNAKFSEHDITTQTKNPRAYDLIINIDVLEHIKRYDLAIGAMKALLKKNGYIFIHTPQEKQTRIFTRFESWAHEDHMRIGFNPDNFMKELREAGFKIVWASETFGTFGKVAWELHHIALSRNLAFAGIVYPLLYIIALLDLYTKNKNGLGIAILAQKK